MKNEFNYSMMLIEKCFYERKKQYLKCEEKVCSGERNLPCNCLTGLGINYWGFVVTNCYHFNMANKLDIEDNICCIFSICDEKILLPIRQGRDAKEKYYFHHKICEKKEVSRDKIYVQGKLENDYCAFMEKYISDTNLQLARKITESDPVCDFLSNFMVSVRTQPMERESKALLAMMLFFFPNRTMKLIFEYMNDEEVKEDEKSYIRDFMNEYNSFLNKIDSQNISGFLLGFSARFEELTGVYVGEEIQKVIDGQENKDFWIKAIFTAYNRNLEEKRRRNSRYNKILAACR